VRRREALRRIRQQRQKLNQLVAVLQTNEKAILEQLNAANEARKPWVVQLTDVIGLAKGDQQTQVGDIKTLGIPTLMIDQLDTFLRSDCPLTEERAFKVCSALDAAASALSNAIDASCESEALPLNRRRLLHLFRCASQLKAAVQSSTVFDGQAHAKGLTKLMSRLAYLLGCIQDWRSLPRDEAAAALECVEMMQGVPSLVKNIIRANIG